jgi:hypothetical protein
VTGGPLYQHRIIDEFRGMRIGMRNLPGCHFVHHKSYMN